MSQSRTVEYGLLSAAQIRRIDLLSLRIMYASSLSAALGSASSSYFLRMDSAVFPGRKGLPAGIDDSSAFMRILRQGRIWICR